MIYDISPPISPNLGVWPGDTPPRREIVLDMKQGDNLTLSALHATVHLGAHVDAPVHYGLDAPAIEHWSADRFIGRCQVMRVSAERGTRMSPDVLSDAVRAERLLFATDTFPDPNSFNQDFAAFAPELIDALAGQGVTLVGIDTPSVDLFTSKRLETHNACLRHDIAILEGIVLRDVPEGMYELIALPLRLVGFDASPVRAVLRSD